MPRPSTPPPSLPSPCLSDLGLSLTVLTDHLSPSHFSTPPTSGAFLAPHYLLLCHSQGLDVLPLVSPPAPAPYALIRRVSFKSVLVMEHRGVLVAISGRRDGVRVYALDEIKKAVEWRLDVEIRREREKSRREEAKRGPPREPALGEVFSLEKIAPSYPNIDKNVSLRRSPSAGATPSRGRPQPKKTQTSTQTPPPVCPPLDINYTSLGPPPSYRSPSRPPQPLRQNSASSLGTASGRGTTVSDVLRGTISRRATEVVGLDNNCNADVKTDWLEESHSDDEAINVVAAGASGSQALDERTSSMVATESMVSNTPGLDGATSRSDRPLSTTTLTPAGFRRAARPVDLDLTETRIEPGSAVPPSPTPTLLTLRQALATSPSSGTGHTMSPMSPRLTNSPIPDLDPDDDDENENGGHTPTNENISFAQALFESRLPDLPPPGTRLPQQAILLTQSHSVAMADEDVPSSPVSVTAQSNSARQSSDTLSSGRRRRRWSVLDGILGSNEQPEAATLTTPQPRDSQYTRTRGEQLSHPPFGPTTPTTTTPHSQSSETVVNSPIPIPTLPPVPAPSHSRFFSRIIGNPFSHRRSEDSADSMPLRVDSATGGARKQQGLTAPYAPAPKLEYVKLPGTKGSLMIKAVETSRKRQVEHLLIHATSLTSMTASSLFYVEIMGRRSSSSLAPIVRHSGCRALSFYRIPHAPWNCSSRVMTLSKSSSSSHRTSSALSLLPFGCAKSGSGERNGEQHAGGLANSK